ncbi:MFS transporter [Streptomyces sp. BE147]|uniref:MFS transporter n=1 Tax=Streptomyces sp. BE147 TaxID=3002524 RepID=UPI002E77B855|nr:MFS transporter [Streptomyces sp. BE147]MEE1736439.1 MFS transporter [Streptomyces sp. BE147]
MNAWAAHRASPVNALARSNVLRACDALSTALITYALPLLVLTMTGSTLLTGLVFAAEWIPRLASIARGGALVDRHGAARVFRAANVLRTVLTALAIPVLAVLPATGTPAIATILALGAACGALAEASFLGAETTGAGLTRRAGTQAHRVQTWQLAIDQGAMLIGPLLGGLLLLVNGGAMLAVATVLSLAAAMLPPAPAAAPSPLDTPAVAGPAGLRTGWRTLRSLPALTCLVVGLSASNLATGLLQASAPITVTRTFDHSTATVGAIWSAAGLATLAATAVCRRFIDRCGLWPIGATAAALASAACLAAALAPNLPVYTALVALLMAAEGVMAVVLRTMRAQLIPPHTFGSTLAVTVLLVLAPMPAAGLLVAAAPAPLLPTLLAGCALLQAAALTWCFTGLRRSPAACPPRAASLPDDAPQPLRPASPSTKDVDTWT